MPEGAVKLDMQGTMGRRELQRQRQIEKEGHGQRVGEMGIYERKGRRGKEIHRDFFLLNIQLHNIIGHHLLQAMINSVLSPW